MARIKFWQYILDEEGRPIQGADIKVYLANSVTEQAEIFLHPTAGVTTTTASTSLTTNGDGFFEFYIGDEWEPNGGYSAEQKFKITWSKAGIATGVIDNINIFPAIFKVDETDNTSLDKAVRNKLVSNELAYTWNDHVEARYGDQPHGVEPVDSTDTNTDINKLVSNSLLNYIFSVLTSAGTISIDASGAVVRDFSITSWTSSGGEYYTVINHFLGRDYPVIQLRDSADDELISPAKVTKVDSNSTRVWVSEDIDAKITVIG